MLGARHAYWLDWGARLDSVKLWYGDQCSVEQGDVAYQAELGKCNLTQYATMGSTRL